MTELNVDRETVFEKLGYEPHSEGQWSAHRSTARFRVANCGRRWGKSTWAAHEMTLKMFTPETVNWIVGPTYTLGEKEFRIVVKDFKKLGLLNPKYTSLHNSPKAGDMSLHFKKADSWLRVVSATKPDSLVGEGLNHVIMSESAKHNMPTWEMYIRPALADKHGTADFPSTPQGFNWFKGLVDLGQDRNYPEYESWHFPTWTNEAMFPGGYEDQELVDIRNNVTKMFWDQEYAALFTSFQGLIFQDFDPQIHCKFIEYQPQWPNHLALDFGFTDPFVCLDIMVDPSNDRIYVWREYQVTQVNTGDHGIALKARENPPGYHCDSISADPRGADEISTLQFMLGSIDANSVGVSLGIEAMNQALKIRSDGLPGLFISPNCPRLIQQMQSIHAKPTLDGSLKLAGDDHGPDALRYWFNEHIVLGGADGLADLYNGYLTQQEAQTFFQYEGSLALAER